MSDEGHKAMGRGVGRRPFVSGIEAPGTSTGSQQAGQGGEAEWQWQGETGHAAEARASGSGSDTVYRRGPSLLSVAISPRKSQTGNPPLSMKQTTCPLYFPLNISRAIQRLEMELPVG